MLRKQITLDDWKSALADMEGTFHLPRRKTSLDDILKKHSDRKVFEDLVDWVMEVTEGATKSELKWLLARSLEILVLLPTTDEPSKEKRRSQRRNDRNMNARMRNFARELQRLGARERERQRVYLKAMGLHESFHSLPDMLRQYADLREKVSACTRLKHPDPNPQFRWARYLLNFFYIIVDKRPYKNMALLIDAVFEHAKKPVPAWASGDRLRQEMGRRADRWRRQMNLTPTP